VNAKYFARYLISTPISIGNMEEIKSNQIKAFLFKFDKVEVTLYDQPLSLNADCYIYADNIEEAEKKSFHLIESINQIFVFSSSCVSKNPKLLKIYNATEGLKEREYKQIFYTPIDRRNVLQLNETVLNGIFNSFFANKIDDRVWMAVNLLRKAYLNDLTVDRFVSYWSGLEALDDLLFEYYKIDKKEKQIKCHECGAVTGTATSKGIEKLMLTELNMDKGSFDEIRRLRGKFLHGEPIFGEDIQKMEGFNLILRKSLIITISKLMNIETSVVKAILEKNISVYQEEARLIIKSTLTDFESPVISDIGKQPDLGLKDVNEFVKSISGNKITKEIRFIGQFNADFKNFTIEFWTDNNSRMSITDLKFRVAKTREGLE
jgi:hypothetical protein